MKDRPVTIRHMAELLGVSNATVSMALRNSPAISPKTCKRVQDLAKKLNYRGNILVNALMTQVRHGRLNVGGEVIGLLLEGTEQSGVPSVAEGVEIASQRAGLAGLKLDVFFLGHRGADSASVDRVLFSRGIRGVIMGPMPFDLKPLEIDWSRYACMAIGYSFHQVMMHRVANSHFQGLMTCYEELRKSGRERIGCVLGRDEDERTRHFWQAAARSAPYLYGRAHIPPLIMDTPLKRSLFAQWFRQHRPDAVIGNYPDHVADWMAQLKMNASYATLDQYAGGPWNGIRQPWAGIFSTAVDQLAGKLARNEFGLPATARTTLIDGVWIEGTGRPG